MAKECCSECGASIVEYRHRLNSNLLTTLEILRNYGTNPVNLKVLNLTRNQWDNFQKLRYWGLVEKAFKSDGKRIGGAWQITQKGIDFLDGLLKIHLTAVTYRGKTDRFEGQEVSAKQVKDKAYKQRHEYVEDSQGRVNGSTN